MPAAIPTYPLQLLVPEAAAVPGVLLIDEQTPTAGPPLGRPYRGDYYKIGLCLGGSAELRANLETYAIGPGSLMLITPQVIKEWTHMGPDHAGISVFFTREFVTAQRHVEAATLDFLENARTHVLRPNAEQQAGLQASLDFLRQKYHAPHPFRKSIVRNLISNLLYEVAALYEQERGARQLAQSRGQLLTAGFKQLLGTHGAAERSVKFYAGQLCITPKHLTETVKETTGRTAGEWIAEAVLLEAKALLLNPQLSVAQVADLLHFPDQSAFGRFFRKGHGLSPTAYKQSS